MYSFGALGSEGRRSRPSRSVSTECSNLSAEGLQHLAIFQPLEVEWSPSTESPRDVAFCSHARLPMDIEVTDERTNVPLVYSPTDSPKLTGAS